jgi:hypothetical protein
MTLADWGEDVKFLAGWLSSQPRNVPLILHGLEMGGLFASRTFAAGEGSALLLWSAPSTANEVLRKGLLRRVVVDHTFKKERRCMSDYVRQLEAGQAVEVEGYQWSTKLWRDSLDFDGSFGASTAGILRDRRRPVRAITLDKNAAPLVKGSSFGCIVSLNPDLTGLFADNFDWIVTALADAKGENSAKLY